VPVALWLDIALFGLTAFNPAETPSPQSLHTLEPNAASHFFGRD